MKYNLNHKLGKFCGAIRFLFDGNHKICFHFRSVTASLLARLAFQGAGFV